MYVHSDAESCPCNLWYIEKIYRRVRADGSKSNLIGIYNEVGLEGFGFGGDLRDGIESVALVDVSTKDG